jgi:hypothetical protein
MKRILILFTLLTIASLACTVSANLPDSPSPPTPDAAVTEEPTNRPTDQPIAAQISTPSETPSFETGAVCFGANLDSGTLRVRACPGLACREVGFLTFGEQVSSNNEYEETDGSTWLRLLSPIEGWVNSRYICEPEANP